VSMDNDGIHFKDWVTPLVGGLGVLFGWLVSAFGTLNRLEIAIAEVRTKQAGITARLDALEARIQVIDEHGTRALDAERARSQVMREILAAQQQGRGHDRTRFSDEER